MADNTACGHDITRLAVIAREAEGRLGLIERAAADAVRSTCGRTVGADWILEIIRGEAPIAPAGNGERPAVYARFLRTSYPTLADHEIAEAWRSATPAECAFWREIDTATGVGDTPALPLTTLAVITNVALVSGTRDRGTTMITSETDEHRCQRPGCNRKLTSDDSKRRGYGKACWRKMRAALAGLSDSQYDEAIEIVELGAVRPTSRPGIWAVDSADFDAEYRVTADGMCSCRHGVKRLTADDQPCKHVGALRLILAITPRNLLILAA